MNEERKRCLQLIDEFIEREEAYVARLRLEYRGFSDSIMQQSGGALDAAREIRGLIEGKEDE